MKLKYIGHRPQPALSLPIGAKSRAVLKPVKFDAEKCCVIPDAEGEKLLAWQERMITAPTKTVHVFTDPETQKRTRQVESHPPHGESHRHWVRVEEKETDEPEAEAEVSAEAPAPKRRGRKPKPTEVAA